MNDIQLPVPLTDLFTVFGMTDPVQMLIALLSLVLGVLLVLIALIAFHGRPSSSNSLHLKGEASGSSVDEKLTTEPFISSADQPQGSNAPALQTDNKVENSDMLADQVEDFQIFKRPRQKSISADRIAPSLESKDQMSTADHLRLIEKEMVRLRDLYQGGHITRDMYIDETRSLYQQARGLSSIS